MSVKLTTSEAAAAPRPRPAPKHVCVVLPVYDEKESLARLFEEVDEAVAGLPHRVSIILVDDGSGEETAAVLDGIAASRDDVTVLHLARNFGHQAALTAGLDEAIRCGADAAITMDSDLQHPPRLIPELVRQWDAGYDVVYTIRDDAAAPPLKRLSAALFYRIIGALSEHAAPRGAADFRLVGGPALAALASLRERARFLRGLSVWIGFRQAAIHYAPEPRFAGRSKYTLGRMWRLALDGLVSTTTLPLRVALSLGLAVSAVSVAYLLYVVAAYFLTDRAIQGWSSVIVTVLLLGAMNLTVQGVQGLYLARVFDEVKGRPIYLVRDRTGGEDAGRR